MIIVEESSDLCNYHKFSPAYYLAYAQDAPAVFPHSQDFNSKLYGREAATSYFHERPATLVNVQHIHIFHASDEFLNVTQNISLRNKNYH